MSAAMPESTLIAPRKTQGIPIGWFGKLPSHGDFLQRRVPDNFLRTWDSWLQACVAQSREHLGDAWLSTYLTSPVWRFFLSRGVIGASTFAGIVLPSVDRVGRYFPLTVLAELPADLPVMAVAIHGREWLTKIEGLALNALRSDDFNLDEFDAALRASGDCLTQVEKHYGVELNEEFPGASRHWRLPMVSVDRVAAALIDPLTSLAGRSLQPLTVWWTDGSEQVSAACLLVQGLPATNQFSAMLDGQWESRGWRGEFGDFVRASPAVFDYSIASAAITDTGVVRSTNQDRFLNRAEAGLWVVADGMGGHSRGEYASQLVVDVIASIEPAANISASLEAARIGLERVNDDLVRSALSTEETRSGSTVVLLSIRQLEWGVLWAGDSRAYLLRDGRVRALTRDHSAAAEDDFNADAPPLSTGEITRAAGGHEELLLDRSTGQLRPGDRFLLCSDGLHGVVAHRRLCELLIAPTDADATVHELLGAAIEAGSRDNITAVVVDVVAQH
jgi:type VI secretion system protein ImpM